LYGLLPSYIGLGDVGRTVYLGNHPDQTSQDENRPKDADLGDGVRAVMENLRHDLISLLANTTHSTFNKKSSLENPPGH
jgi:hypothetical protein